MEDLEDILIRINAKSSWALIVYWIRKIGTFDEFKWICFSVIVAYGLIPGFQKLFYTWNYLLESFPYHQSFLQGTIEFIVTQITSKTLWHDLWDSMTYGTLPSKPTSVELETLATAGKSIPSEFITCVRVHECVRQQLLELE